MNIRKFNKYHFSRYIHELLWYYFVLLLLFIGLTITAVTVIANTNDSHTIIFSGFEAMSMLFLFICAASAYTAVLKIAIQNSISRKTVFASTVIMGICMSLIMSLADKLFSVIFGTIGTHFGTESYTSLYSMIYGDKLQSPILNTIHGLLFTFLIYLFTSALGYFIVALYYRMNLALKIIVSIGAPGLGFIVLPVINYLTDNAVINAMLKFFNFTFGLGLLPGTAFSAPNAIIFMFLMVVLFYLFFWLVIRRTPVNK